MARIHHDLLPGLKLVFYHMAVKLRKHDPMAAYLLHNESFSAEQAGTKLLIKEYGQFDSHLSCQERAILKNCLLYTSRCV